MVSYPKRRGSQNHLTWVSSYPKHAEQSECRVLGDRYARLRLVADAEQWDQLWLPVYPLASDDFVHGVYRMARGKALGHRYVETNPQALSNLLVVDIDHPDSALRALSAQGNHPLPTAIVENPANGHAHAVWALQEPVTRTERARLKPLTYAAAVVEGLRRAVDGDAAYSGLLTKNPIHEDWETLWLGDRLRSLRQLEEELGRHMPPTGWRKSSGGAAVGLGRNCSLFEDSRHWAYRELRNWFGDPLGLSTAILGGVQERNQQFAEPLPVTEARAIAASITRWITTKSRLWKDGPVVYDATFTLIQSARSQKAAEKRRASSVRAAVEKLATERGAL